MADARTTSKKRGSSLQQLVRNNPTWLTSCRCEPCERDAGRWTSPLLTTPNHPEYPCAHCVITAAMTEVFSAFLGSNRIGLELHGFGPAGPTVNLNAVRNFDRPNDLRQEIINARIWAGLHYHFSGIAGVVLGRNVAKYDLRQAFRPVK